MTHTGGHSTRIKERARSKTHMPGGRRTLKEKESQKKLRDTKRKVIPTLSVGRTRMLERTLYSKGGIVWQTPCQQRPIPGIEFILRFGVPAILMLTVMWFKVLATVTNRFRLIPILNKQTNKQTNKQINKQKPDENYTIPTV